MPKRCMLSGRKSRLTKSVYVVAGHKVNQFSVRMSVESLSTMKLGCTLNKGFMNFDMDSGNGQDGNVCCISSDATENRMNNLYLQIT